MTERVHFGFQIVTILLLYFCNYYKNEKFKTCNKHMWSILYKYNITRSWPHDISKDKNGNNLMIVTIIPAIKCHNNSEIHY